MQIALYRTTILLLQALLTSSFQSANKETQKSTDEVEIKGLNKECNIIQECHECTFEEMKSIEECMATRFKQINHCKFFDDYNKIRDESFKVESCESEGINQVYVLLVLYIAIGVLSYMLKRYQKQKIIGNTLNKLKLGINKQL